MTGYFELNGVNSADFGIILTKAPPMEFAQRDVETVQVPGRSGDLVMDNGRYNNVTLKYTCALIPPSGETMRETVISALGYLRQLSTYARLEDSFHPDCFRLAMAVDSVSVDSLVEKAGEFTLKLECKPQRFLKSGETAVEFDAAGEIENPTLFPSQPLIKVTGTGAGAVTVGDATVRIDAITDFLYLDCETMNAYYQAGEAAAENKNGDIYAPTFPSLLPGSNPVSWTGDITGLTITPRWWTL